MTDPVLVCGMGHVGYRIVQLLRRLGEPVVVVTDTTREEWRRAAEAEGVRVVQGDARDEAVLQEAGLARARALIAATDDDPANIEMALDARRVRPDLPVVIRLFDQDLARHLESSFEIRRALAVSALAAPAFAAAALGERWIGSFTLEGEEFVIGRIAFEPEPGAEPLTVQGLAERHGLATILEEGPDGGAVPAPPGDTALVPGGRATVVGGKSDWERWTWGAAGRPEAPRRWRWMEALNPWQTLGLVRKAWRGAPLPLRSAFVLLNALIALSVLVFRYTMDLSLVDALYFIISTVTTVGYGDITPRAAGVGVKLYACLVMLIGSAGIAVLYSIITDFVVTARFQELLGRQRIPEKGHVIVAGLGNVGYRVVQELLRAGAAVVAIERDPHGEFVEAVRGLAPVVVGDARVPDTLGKAGVARAHAVVAAIDDDAVDLGIVLAARRINPGARTVARVFDADFARKVQGAFRVDAMSPPLMAAPAFVASALYPDVVAAFVQDQRLHVLLRRSMPGGWQGRTPSRLQAEEGVQVLLRRAAGERAHAVVTDDRALAPDEEVIALVSRAFRK